MIFYILDCIGANPNVLKTHKQLPFGLESPLKVILWLAYGFTMLFTMVFTMVYHIHLSLYPQLWPFISYKYL